MKSIETPTTLFILTDDGILIGRAINPETPRSAETTAAALGQLEVLLEGDRCPGLWDPRTIDRFPAEAWSMMISRLEKSLVALAILIDDTMAGSLGAFPDAIGSILMPVRTFQDEAEAMNWLRQFANLD